MNAGTGRGDIGPLTEIVELVRHRLVAQPGALSPARVAQALRETGMPVGDATVLAVHDALHGDIVGAGPLQPLLQRPGVTDVLVNGPDAVFVDCGEGLTATDVRFADEDAVRRLAQRLAASAGRRLDDATPYVDVRMRDGTRLHAVLAPVARPGTLVSLRVPPRVALSLDDWCARGSMTGAGARLLRDLVAARLALLISGGTGSGKTTLLATLLGLVDPAERIVVVEDSTELVPRHPHVVSLEARPPNIEGAGEVTLRDLVRQALRMRPDRLVLGEVRGAEVTELLAALNTGHEGGFGTLHANSASDVPARIEALALAAGLPREAVHSQLASAVDAVVHLVRTPTARSVRRVAVPVRGADGLVVMRSAVEFTEDGRSVTGPGCDVLEARLAERGR